jgi:hypothetical protein
MPNEPAPDDTLLTDLDFPGQRVRILNVMWNCDIKTIADVKTWTREKLLRHKHFGRKSLHSLEAALYSAGHMLKGATPPPAGATGAESASSEQSAAPPESSPMMTAAMRMDAALAEAEWALRNAFPSEEAVVGLKGGFRLSWGPRGGAWRLEIIHPNGIPTPVHKAPLPLRALAALALYALANALMYAEAVQRTQIEDIEKATQAATILAHNVHMFKSTGPL